MLFIRSSRGSMDMWIIMVVIIGAFLLAGGMMVIQGDTAPGANNTNNSVGNSGNGSSWNAQFSVKSCDTTTHIASTQIIINGPENGYWTIQFGNGTDILSQGFTNPPTAVYTLKTIPSENNQPVTITLYSGGSSDSTSGTEVWSGGTQQGTPYSFPPVNCQ